MLQNEQGDYVWQPSLKQEKFLQVPLTVKEAFYGGAVQSGKSDVLIMYPIIHGWHLHPEFKGVYFRRTMPELRNEVIPRAEKYFSKFGATFNETKSLFTFPSGALFFFSYCQYEKDVHNYDSMQINYAAFDELTSFTEWMYLYIMIERVRIPKYLTGILPAIVRSGSNPGNIGHAWTFKRFIKPHPEGGILMKGKGDIKRIFIPATIMDNPHADDDYKKGLDALPDAERKAKKEGDWNAYEGQVFEEFREFAFPGEPPHALHVKKPFEIPEYWPRILIGDWGFKAYTYLAWTAISPNRQAYVYREQYWLKTKIEEWAPYVKEYIDKENPRLVKFCQSAGQQRGQEHTIQEQISSALDIPIELTTNSPGSRIAGKILLHEYFRWKETYQPKQDIQEYDNEKALWLLRNRPPKEYHSYLKSFDPTEEFEILPKLLIFDTCEMLIQTIKSCVYAKPREGIVIEDVAQFEGDDPYDVIRYTVDAVDNFFETSVKEFEMVKKREALVKRLADTKDWTAYYRSMEAIESRNAPMKVARRFHRPRVH